MLFIYLTIESSFKRFYQTRSFQFKAGFEECLRLLDIGMTKHPQYNAFVLLDQLEREKIELQKIIKKQEKEIRHLSTKAKEKSIFTSNATQFFVEYPVHCDFGDFTIITNMGKGTFSNMCMNFGFRYVYKDLDEAKAMMLGWINSKSLQGFKAFKDEKTALKEGVKIKR